MSAATSTVSHIYPLGSRVNERGHLEIAGCDVVELAGEFGTPAYVYAEDDIRAEREHIDRQKQRIEELEQGGHATGQAERSLGMMERTLAAFDHHRRILIERLGLYRPQG